MRGLAALALLVLAGCSVLFPDTEPEPYVPEDLIPAPSASLAALDSRAAVLAGARPLSIDLAQAIELVGARSSEIQLARLRVEQERSVERGDEFSLLPGINPIFRPYAHTGRAQPQTGKIVDVTRTNFEAQLFLVLLAQPGSSIFSALASRRRQDAAEAATETTRLEAVRQAARGYFELVRARAFVRLAREAVAEAAELERTATSRAKLGAGLETDVLRARAERAEREQDLSLALGSVAVASARLVRVLQLGPDVELTPIEEEPGLVVLFPETASVTSLVSIALDERPELSEARSELAAREKLEQSVTWGRLVPFLGGFLQTGDFGPTLGKMRFSQDAFAIVGWQIGPGGIGDIPAIRQRRLDVRQQRLSIEQLDANIVREVAFAKAEVEARSAELEAAREGVLAARESLRVARDRLVKGAGIELEVLDAERLYFRSRAREIEATVAFDEAQYDLLRAVGKAPGS